MDRFLALLLLILGIVGPVVALAAAAWFWWHRRRALASVALIGVVVSSQVSSIPYLVGADNLFPVLHYESSDGGFQGSECFKSPACSWEELPLNFAHYRMVKGDPSITLHRTFHPALWRFWRWWEYLSEPRWRLAYAPALYCVGSEMECEPGTTRYE